MSTESCPSADVAPVVATAPIAPRRSHFFRPDEEARVDGLMERCVSTFREREEGEAAAAAAATAAAAAAH